MGSDNLYQAIPSVDRLLAEPGCEDLLALYSRASVVEALRIAQAWLRTSIEQGGDLPPRIPEGARAVFSPGVLLSRAASHLDTLARPSLAPVINATGVIGHTNLGRAPLALRALQAMDRVSRGYCNLEYDLDQGHRGSRFSHLDNLFSRFFPGTACLVVNNNAAAVYLVLSALARGREVILSRGELIEIGGSFRIPDVMVQSAAILREVGTTNRTHLRDYEQAITPDTGLLMKAHTSNYVIQGFTASVSASELVPLARSRNVPLYEDLGSGALVDLRPHGLAQGPNVAEALSGGVDLLSFSGDKLLGGPQAGIILGRPDLVAQLRKHPMARALRPDKLTIAALEATLQIYGSHDPWTEIPVLEMIARPLSQLESRARDLTATLGSLALVESARVARTQARVGGGALPGEVLESAALGLRVKGSLDAIEQALRGARPPVVARVEDDELLFDLRTVGPDQDGILANTLTDLLSR